MSFSAREEERVLVCHVEISREQEREEMKILGRGLGEYESLIEQL